MSVTSSVCLIAKNEGKYLKEWISYHRILGFDEIIVYENNSEDESSELLQFLSRQGKVTHRRWTLGARESAQITAYRDALKRCKTDWILFIDADEFLVLHDHLKVNDFLQPFHDQPDISCVGINWRIFGDNGLPGYDSRPVTERFTRASKADFPVNAHLKSFIRRRAQKGIVHMHVCETTGRMVHASGEPLTMPNWGLSEKIELTHAQVNHYYTKTFEEYATKKNRGSADVPDTDPNKKFGWYHDEAFRGHNRNDVEDTSILKLSEALRKEMALMGEHVSAL